MFCGESRNFKLSPGKCHSKNINLQISPPRMIIGLDHFTFLMHFMVLYLAIIVFETGERNSRRFAVNHGVSSSGRENAHEKHSFRVFSFVNYKTFELQHFSDDFYNPLLCYHSLWNSRSKQSEVSGKSRNFKLRQWKCILKKLFPGFLFREYVWTIALFW